MDALQYKGKRRDDAAIDYFCGAITGIKIIGHQDEAEKLSPFVAFVLAFKGYDAVLKLAAEPLTSADPMTGDDAP